MTNWIDKQCLETVWLTPENVLEPIRKYFGGEIPLDPATQPNNPTKAQHFYTEQTNGLDQEWNWGTFVNPPYGKVIRDWCHKIGEESIRKKDRAILALMPCGSGRPGTRYWQSSIFQPQLNAICYLKGRLQFMRGDGTVAKNNTYPSHILGFNVDQKKFAECFQHLGSVMHVKIV